MSKSTLRATKARLDRHGVAIQELRMEIADLRKQILIFLNR